jgi:rhomboid protease GluP
MLNGMPEAGTVVYLAASRSECDERSFMLAAVGIRSSIDFDGLQHALRVDPSDLAVALGQLQAYEAERRAAPAPAAVPASAPRVHAGSWAGALAYVGVLVFVALAVGNGFWPPDAFERGELSGAAVQAGEWWRAWTALTLHADAAHLAANLGAGVWFGTLAARQLGVGNAWLLIVTGAASANLFDAHFGPDSYRSVGASTAVFTALGLMAAHSWRTRFYLPQRPVMRWAPLVAGVILLGWFGSAGEGTDLVAHALGFIVGGLLGVAAAFPGMGAVLDRVPQWAAGLLAAGSVAVAWGRALSHALSS